MDTLILIDASGFLYAAHYRLPNLQTSDGEMTGAIYGFTKMLWRFMQYPPCPYTHIAAVFDAGGRNWRHDVDARYKAGRAGKKPNALTSQGQGLRQAALALGVSVLELAEQEADDVIATYARRARQAEMPCVIVSGDKDMMQLLDEPRIRVWNQYPRGTTDNGMSGPAKTPPHWVTAEHVRDKFGVRPQQVTDVQALAGDFTDGISGIRAIGLKIAGDLVTRFGNLDGVIAEAKRGVASMIRGRHARAIVKDEAVARRCKRLAALDIGVDLHVPLEDLIAKPPSPDDIATFLKRYEMWGLAERFARDMPGLMVAA